jgi:hypothetical protein
MRGTAPLAYREAHMRADVRKNYDRLLVVARDIVTEQGVDASLRNVARRAARNTLGPAPEIRLSGSKSVGCPESRSFLSRIIPTSSPETVRGLRTPCGDPFRDLGLPPCSGSKATPGLWRAGTSKTAPTRPARRSRPQTAAHEQHEHPPPWIMPGPPTSAFEEGEGSLKSRRSPENYPR